MASMICLTVGFPRKFRNEHRKIIRDRGFHLFFRPCTSRFMAHGVILLIAGAKRYQHGCCTSYEALFTFFLRHQGLQQTLPFMPATQTLNVFACDESQENLARLLVNIYPDADSFSQPELTPDFRGDDYSPFGVHVGMHG
jgi:hypothetical protein